MRSTAAATRAHLGLQQLVVGDLAAAGSTGRVVALRNRLGVVPLVPLINRPRLDGTGQSELLSVLPIQDAINKLVMDMIVASEFSAYRQRTATGISIEIDEVTGEPVEQFQADVARIWAAENEKAQFGTLEASDLQPFVSGVEMLIQHLASQTRTPYHFPPARRPAAERGFAEGF